MEIAIISIIVLIFSVILHEIAHGYMAEMLGDGTARYAGRLTLNPLSHIDIFGSLVVPGLLLFAHSPILFGWAKPVPYNPYNIRHPLGEALVALAGPATNILLAVVFAGVMRAGFGAGDMAVTQLLYTIVGTNVLLALFNLLPVPPLDGSKVLAMFLPRSLRVSYEQTRRAMEQNPVIGMVAIILFVFVFGSLFDVIVTSLTHALIG